MSIETTVFTFKINVPYEEWAAVYDSDENIQMNKERGILIEQGEEGKSIAMFEDPVLKPLIESAGHIYDSTVISSYF